MLPENPRSVLDVGTGHSGVFDFWNWESRDLELKARLDVHSIRPDIPDSWLKVIADGADMPFEDNIFDVVQSTETLEHVPPEKWDKFLDELCRVSKDLIYLTTSAQSEHLGKEQKRYEQANPFRELFLSKGFHTLFISPYHTIAFKRKIPEWRSKFKDMADYVVELCGDMEVESVVDVGTGVKGVVAQGFWEKRIPRGYAVDIWTIKPLPPPWQPILDNALRLEKFLDLKSVDIVQNFGFLEHLTKEDGYRFLQIAERVARKLVILSAATYVHGACPDYKVKMDGNPYHYYHSTWHWKDFEELGYETNFEDMRRGITFSDEAIAWKRIK